MDVELQATCSALGYQEGNSYVKEPYCLETVKDLIRFLRRDTDTCDIRRQLGHAKIVQNDLIPLVKGYHKDKTLFETITKLLVNLTQPVVSVYNNEIPEEKTLRNYCLEIESHLQDTKEAFVDDELFGILTDKIKNILRLDWEHRREDDRLQLERLFILIRNVLMIPPDPERELRTDDDATIHDQILWVAHTSGLEDLILYVASSDNERNLLCMHVMEIISLMFREHDVESLAFAGVQRSTTEKEKDQRELEMAREKEKAQKKTNVLKYSARHSRFGGTFVMKNIKSITDQDVIYHKPLCEVKSFSYDDGKVPKKKSKNLAPIKGNDQKRRSTLIMRLSLKDFCVQFLLNAYNPLMRAVKDALTHKSIDDNDETYYLWAMRYFMEFCRLCCKRVDLVSETMSMATFHYIYVQLCTYYENSQLGKREEAKTWGRRSHLALKAYQELLRTLDFMSRSSDKQLRESAKIMQSNVFYMMEYRDIFVTLLKKFNESKQSRAYLRDLVESTHLFLKMLESFNKVNRHLVVAKKGKKKKQKRNRNNVDTADGNSQPELTEEELTSLWEEEISARVSEVLQGGEEIPTDVSPFDAASEISEEQQKVETMSRIQTCLREKKFGEATALLRASREIWPENSQFGNEGEGWEEELGALKEIFMASLPRPQTARSQEAGDDGDDNDNALNDALNDELGEEMEEVTRNEQQFNFQSFVKEFAHQSVIKSYATLLAEFTENSDAVNHCIVRMLHRICHDLGYVGMVFQASVFKTFSKLLHRPLAHLTRYKELAKFSCWVIRQFSTAAMVNKKIFVDVLFWKNKSEALAITGDYDFAPKSKVKVPWTEDEEEELTSLFEKYKDQEQLELDTIELIIGELTSSHTRIQVLKKLKGLGLISSAKDLRKKNSKRIWREEENEELRAAFEEVKNSSDPVGNIRMMLSFEKSKYSITKQILALGIVTDKKDLRKRRGGKSQRGGTGSVNESSEENSDSESDEGERLFPEESGRGRRGRRAEGSSDESSDEDDDYHEGDDVDDNGSDDDVRLLVRQSASSIGDYIARLVENGYKEQVEWIQKNLRTVAEDREDGTCYPTPIVPLTEENETAMEDEIFLIFLKAIGFTSPTEGQEMFWRIPKEFSAPDLLAIADSISIDESGLSPGADAVQAIVTRVFPSVNKSQPGSEHQSRRDKGKKKMTKDKEAKRQKKDQSKKKKEHKRKSKASASNKDSDESDNDDDNGKEKTHLARIVLYANRKLIDPDTSDSGLDPEIEALELQRIHQEKKGEKKKGKINAKDRRAALEKLMKKKNEKRGRRERGSKESENATPSQSQSTSAVEEPKSPAVEGPSGPSVNESVLSQPLSPTATPLSSKKKAKRITVMDSDSDSDLDLSLSQGPTPDDDNDNNDDGTSQKSLAKGKAKKRALESDSDEEDLPRHNTPSDVLEDEVVNESAKVKKRMRIMSSDEESDNDVQNISSNSEGPEPSASAHDSDKENLNNTSMSGKDSQNTLDESLRLHFDDSSDEDADGDRKKEKSDKDDMESQSEKSISKLQTIDSFPATMLTQDLVSDDDDDHVPLSTALKRKRAVIDDEDEES